MRDFVSVTFGPMAAPDAGTLVVLVGEDLALSPKVAALLGDAAGLVARAAGTMRFKGKAKTALDLPAPAGLAAERLLVLGLGKDTAEEPRDYVTLGGFAMGKIGGGRQATLLAEVGPEAAADLLLGLRLRAYAFDAYKTKKKDEDKEREKTARVTLAVPDPAAARKAARAREAVAGGVELARTLVNEPPNVLNPAEFARRAGALADLGVEVEVLGEEELGKLGMGALLAVGRGSANGSHVVLLRWNGAPKGRGAKHRAPVAFVGKGVTFDTGGISIKPAAGMEDMKGDMAGAACVLGLMHALATRKAKVDAIGAIGLVENMPDGASYRPGDILTSLSGQTIEVINTDAEGRLVLADVLWHVQATYKPAFMIDLATLTGAILVALGQDRAGLFSNDDDLAGRLAAAAKATGEEVWRMPLGKAYDKMIDSKFADMKNTGGRHGGSITAAQFLQRFVNDVPWAHLDIAGTGMGSTQTEINQSWGSGWGVRLLDRLVADHYEG